MDVYGFQFDVTFDKSVLAVSGATEGPFLASGGGHTFWVPGRIGTGSLSAVADTLLGSVAGVSGNGSLARIPFVGLVQGTADVNISNILLLDSSMRPIAASSASGGVTITPEPSTGALVLGTLLLLVLTRSGPARSGMGMLLLALLPVSGKPASPGYELRILALTSDLANDRISINSSGTVVYSTFGGVYTQSGPVVTLGQVIAGKTLTGFRSPQINDAGKIVFEGTFNYYAGTGIFTPTGQVAGPGDNIAGSSLGNFIFNPALNNSGLIAFYASASPPGGIFTTTERIVQEFLGVIDGVSVSQIQTGSITVNDADTILFGAYLVKPSTPYRLDSGIFTASHLLVSSGDRLGGVLISKIDGDIGLSANAAGSLVFVGNDFTAIFSLSELLVSSGTNIGGKTLQRLSTAVINESGTMVFTGYFETSGFGIFTPSELIVASGDVIDGKVLSSVGSPAINKFGTIAFAARFTDGSSAIVTATPIPSTIPGDANSDGSIDCTDLAIIKASLGKSYGQAGYNPRADTNSDNVIDLRDLAFVAQQLTAGQSCP